ncbi:MAG: ankyrin repeat domain-containing protein [Candidatus Babeliales bacterium]
MKIVKSKIIVFFFLLTPLLALTAEDKSQEILLKAVNKNDVAGAGQVLAWGADVNQKDVFGRTLLMIAAMCGYLQMAKLLIDEGALINETNNKDETALMLAVSKNYVPVVALLLEKNVDVGKVNSQGQTALDIAKNQGNMAATKMIEGFIAKKRKKRREETSEAILKTRPEVYPAITEEIAEFEIGK